MTSATILTFRKPSRRLSDRACDKLREAKTAELVNEQINRDFIRGFFAEAEAQRIWDDAVRAFGGGDGLMAQTWMKEPCEHCPFRRDVRPFLRPERAEDLAYSTENPYSDFYCHKTIDHDEDDGEGIIAETSLTCAGFLSMQVNYAIECPDGFEPSRLAYSDSWEMIGAYEEQAAGKWEPC